MNKLIENWKYLGLGNSQAKKYARASVFDNMATLMNQSPIFAIVIFAIAMFLFLINKNFLNSFFLILTGLLLFLIYFLAKLVPDKSEESIKKINILILLFSMILYICCILESVVLENSPSAFFVSLLVFIPINFDLLPTTNFKRTASALLIFLICSFVFKEQKAFYYDILFSVSASFLGLYISWNKSKVKWKYSATLNKLGTINYELYNASTIDGLTGLPNRTQAFASFDHIGNNCLKSGTNFVCMIIDIDNFKQFNDNYGHPEGDNLLRSFGNLLQTVPKKYKLNVARIGGEEFMIFGASSTENAILTAQKILHDVQLISHPNSDMGMKVTVSIGIHSEIPFDIFELEKVYSAADNALYHAKTNGRNCIWKSNSDLSFSKV